MKRILFLLVLVLAISIAAQASYTIPNLLNDLVQVWHVKKQPSQWRGAKFNQGEKTANYILFLRSKIPQDALVVLPPPDGERIHLNTTPFMQFFLWPRQVINCTTKPCFEANDSAYKVILTQADQLLLQDHGGQAEFFSNNWGVYQPRNGGTLAQNSMDTPLSNMSLLLSALLPLAWLFFMGLCGSILVHRLIPTMRGTPTLVLGSGVSLIFFSITVACASLAGFNLDAVTLFIITCMIGIIPLFISVRIFNQDRRRTIQIYQDTIAWLRINPWELIYILISIAAALLSVGKGYHTIDAIQIWGVKGYGIAADQTIKSVAQWGTNTLPYPLHIPILIAGFQQLFSDILPASKLLFCGFYFGTLILIDETLRRGGIPRLLCGISTLLVATCPLILRHASIAYANLPLTFYLIAGVVLLFGVDDNSTNRHGRLFLAGCMLSAAAWTRPEGLQFAWLAIGYWLFITLRQKKYPHKSPGNLFVFLPLLCYSAFWVYVNYQVYTLQLSKASLPVVAARAFLEGNFNFLELFHVFKSLFTHLIGFSVWGMLGFVVIAYLFWIIFMQTLRRSGDFRLANLGVLWGGLVIFIYYVASYDTLHDLSWWLSTGLDRMLLPAVLLLFLGGLWSFNLADNR